MEAENKKVKKDGTPALFPIEDLTDADCDGDDDDHFGLL